MFRHATIEKVFKAFDFNVTSVCLVSVADRTTSDSLMPFISTEYGIYYKITDFHVSSTYFVDGLSSKLWIYSFLACIAIFIGFLITSKVHCYYSKRSWIISDILMYQANFWYNQTVYYYLDYLLSWKTQLMNVTMLNIILMTTFSAKYVSLMSVRHFEQPFNNLEDFVRLRTHQICVPYEMKPLQCFIQNSSSKNPVSFIKLIFNVLKTIHLSEGHFEVGI